MKLKTLIPKSEARKIVVTRRIELSDSEVNSKSESITNKILNNEDVINATNIFCYINSRPGEVSTRKLIDTLYSMGKSIVLPKLNKKTKSFNRFNFLGWDKIEKNNEGYWEPMLGIDEDLSDIDVIILPALAISVKGYRVGYGGGYYDKLLKHNQSPKFVPAFEFQIFDYIENSVHDIRVDKIFTERRVIDTREESYFI